MRSSYKSPPLTVAKAQKLLLKTHFSGIPVANADEYRQKAYRSINFFITNKYQPSDPNFAECICDLKEAVVKIDFSKEFNEQLLNKLFKVLMDFLNELRNFDKFPQLFILVARCVLNFSYQEEYIIYQLYNSGFPSVFSTLLTCPMPTRIDEDIYESVALAVSKSKRLRDSFAKYVPDNNKEGVFSLNVLSRNIRRSDIHESLFSCIIKLVYAYSINITTNEETQTIVKCFKTALSKDFKTSYPYAIYGLIHLLKNASAIALYHIKINKINELIQNRFNEFDDITVEHTIYYYGIFLQETNYLLIPIDNLLDILLTDKQQVILAVCWLITVITQEDYQNLLQNYDIKIIIEKLVEVYENASFNTKPFAGDAIYELTKLPFLDNNTLVYMCLDGMFDTFVDFYQFPKLMGTTIDFLTFIFEKSEEMNLQGNILEAFSNANGFQRLFEVEQSQVPEDVQDKVLAFDQKI